MAFPGFRLMKNIDFLLFLKNASRTDGPMDGRTDRPGYRDARTHLKILNKRANEKIDRKQTMQTKAMQTKGMQTALERQVKYIFFFFKRRSTIYAIWHIVIQQTM